LTHIIMKKESPRQRSTGRVTLADVAAAAGVSAMTASRALSGKRAVDPVLVERVLAVSDKLGYVPDPAARALASHRSNHVAVLIPLLSNELFVTLLEAVQSALRSEGFQTFISVTHYNPAEEEQLLREQLMHRPAGLLVTGFDRTPAAQKLIESSGVPCVYLMETSTRTDVFSVGFSQAEAAYDMTQHLLAMGRRRIAFAAAQLDPRTLQRLNGWRKALTEAGLYAPTLEWMNPAPSSMALGGIMFEQIMGQNPPLDAIFFCNDDLAQGALLAANRLGITVPGRVAVAGFNDLRGSDLMNPPLTTVHTPLDRVGEASATMLLKLMRGEEVQSNSLDLGYRLVLRQST
jgi:LacI family gluconate utilization system Gnt-I transcriptional repressor